MNALLPAAILLCITTSNAVGNKVFGNLEDLAKIGFIFTAEDKRDRDTVAFRVKIPKVFEIEDVGPKPFSSISLIHLDQKVEHGPKLIGAPGSYIPLESRKTNDGRHEATIGLPTAKAGMSYLMITFEYPYKGDGADWPMLIHIPVSNIVKQLDDREATAPGTPTRPDSASSPKQ